MFNHKFENGNTVNIKPKLLVKNQRFMKEKQAESIYR